MNRLVESDECERCGDRIDVLRRLCPGLYARSSQCTGGAAMSSRASEFERSTASGDALEAEIVQVVDALEYVSDHTATWHDAQTTAVLEASQSLPFYGIVLVEPDVPLERPCRSSGRRATATARDDSIGETLESDE